MIVEQGSDAWHQKRLGKATASRIKDIIARGKTKDAPSLSRARYLGELVAERLSGQPTQSYKSPDMEWGSATEAEARHAYTFHIGATVTQIDFVDHPRIPMSGASPDSFVGADGLLEIKCPATHTHVATLLGDPVESHYITQMQWQMACTGRNWCDFVSFDPRLPEDMRLFVTRVVRDDARIADLERAVIAFLGDVDDTVTRLMREYRHVQAA